MTTNNTLLNTLPKPLTDYTDQELLKLRSDIKELAEMKGKYTVDDLVAGRVDTSLVKKYGYSMAANFEFYKKDKKSVLSEIMNHLYSGRKQYKNEMLKYQQLVFNLKEEIERTSNTELNSKLFEYENLTTMYDNLQLALKILLNSVYGCASNVHFLYYSHENAESITITGQLVNRYTTERVVKFLQEMTGNYTHKFHIFGDTDSAGFSLKPIVDSFGDAYKEQPMKIVDLLDRFANEILTPKIDSITDQLAEYLNSYENKMVWGREAISPKGFFVAKKKYVMKIYDLEGVRFSLEHPKYKITGMESKKSDTPAWSRNYLEECYKLVLNGTEEDIQQLVKQISDDFDTLSLDIISRPKGITELEKYSDPVMVYTKGTPKHVKAALLHNRLLKDKGIVHIDPIMAGSKMKYLDLKLPNPINESVIGFESRLPTEFGLDKYVDKEVIFNASFIKPLTIALNSVGWDHEEKISMESFFG